MKSDLPSRLLGRAGVLVGVAVVYFAAGKLGLRMAFDNPSASPVWAPTGLALAAFLVLGYRIWPAIYVSAFLVNVTTAGSAATSLCIAAGNTLEGAVGAWLVDAFAGGGALQRARDVFRFALLAAVLSTTVSATVGVTSLALAGFADWARYGSIWLTWWLGDTAGDLVVAPLVLLWSTNPRMRWRPRRALEVGLLLLSLLLVGALVFAGFFPAHVQNYPLEFVCVLFLIWAAFRFGPREVATAVVVLSAIAIWGTMRFPGRCPEHTQRVPAPHSGIHGLHRSQADPGRGRLEQRAAEAFAAAGGDRRPDGPRRLRRLISAVGRSAGRSARKARRCCSSSGRPQGDQRPPRASRATGRCAASPPRSASCRSIDVAARFGGDSSPSCCRDGRAAAGRSLAHRGRAGRDPGGRPCPCAWGWPSTLATARPSKAPCRGGSGPVRGRSWAGGKRAALGACESPRR
jgi:integral membrane sensor domain MASE1